MRILVTGASTGIGEGCTRWFDARGHRVFAGVRREADGARLKTGGSDRLTPVLLDVTDEVSIRAAFSQIESASGGEGLDGLVNNAGIAVAGPLEHLALDALRRQLEVNVVGQVAVTQAFLPLLRRSRGRIVFIGSIGGRFTTPFLAPYARRSARSSRSPTRSGSSCSRGAFTSRSSLAALPRRSGGSRATVMCRLIRRGMT
jgi:NAD(P)-dependent dehydrogenase (short-subunit alcohol dehydrogenase family)